MLEAELCVESTLKNLIGVENVKRLGDRRIWVRSTRCEEYAIALACANHNTTVQPEAMVRFELEIVFPPVFVEPACIKTDTVICLGNATNCCFVETLEAAFRVQPEPRFSAVPPIFLDTSSAVAGKYVVRAAAALVITFVLMVGLILKDVYLPIIVSVICAVLVVYGIGELKKSVEAVSGNSPIDYDDGGDE